MHQVHVLCTITIYGHGLDSLYALSHMVCLH